MYLVYKVNTYLSKQSKFQASHTFTKSNTPCAMYFTELCQYIQCTNMYTVYGYTNWKTLCCELAKIDLQFFELFSKCQY